MSKSVVDDTFIKHILCALIYGIYLFNVYHIYLIYFPINLMAFKT